jgi:hypothetical protein
MWRESLPKEAGEEAEALAMATGSSPGCLLPPPPAVACSPQVRVRPACDTHSNFF